MKKKNLRLLLATVVMAATVLCGSTAAFGLQPLTPDLFKETRPISSNVFVNGKITSNGDYVKLRDIARVLNFAVDWDGTDDTIMVDTSKPYAKIESITYKTSPAQGLRGNMITYEITVYASGYILKQSKNDFGEIQSHSAYNVDKDSIHELFDSFYKNGFFDWPDNLSSDSCDGSFIYFVVETENNSYKKGGLNPYFEGFRDCKEVFDKCINAGSIIISIER